MQQEIPQEMQQGTQQGMSQGMHQEVYPYLGNFSKLPFELREMIWSELASAEQKTGLGILRTSRCIYGEMSSVLYERSSLEFTISGDRRYSKIWSTVTLKGRSNVEATWTLSSFEDVKSRGWYRLPFHKFEGVVVTMLAPDPNDEGQLFGLWQTVTELVDLFQKYEHASDVMIPRLILRLAKHESYDWTHRWAHTQYGYDLVVLPFCTLRNVTQLDLETHSKALEEDMDRATLNWEFEIFEDRSWNRCSSASEYEFVELAERDVDRKVADDYVWMYAHLWDSAMGRAASLARLDILNQWFTRGDSGHSEIETRIRQIDNTYPEMFERSSAVTSSLRSMHMAVVCMHHWAKIGQRGDESWDSRAEEIRRRRNEMESLPRQ